MKVKIAVVQFKIKRLSPDYNLKRAEEFIRKASKQKANIIIFPEDFITDPISGKIEYADSKKKYRDYFCALAKKYKIDIIPGSFIERDRKGCLFNTTYYIDSDGKVRTMYRKIHLWHPERSYILPGNRISVVNTKYGKIGLCICWDLIFPEMFRKMLSRGVNIVFCPSYWCYGDAGIGVKYDRNSEIKLVDSLCVSRAFENNIVLVYCNAAGKFDNGKYKDTLIGHSQITIPFKGVLFKLNHNKEDMFIQEVDLDILKNAERAYKIRKDFKESIV